LKDIVWNKKIFKNVCIDMHCYCKKKDNVISNLILRFELEILPSDNSRNNNQLLNDDEINPIELRKKAEALAQRTVLENFELREVVNTLDDDNFRLHAEIYNIQDKLNRSVLKISHLETELAKVERKDKTDEDETMSGDEYENRNRNNNNNGNNNQQTFNDISNNNTQNNGNFDTANTEEAKRIRADREAKHTAQTSYVPDLYNENDDGNADNDNDDNDDEQVTQDYANTEQAKQIREEREKKTSFKTRIWKST